MIFSASPCYGTRGWQGTHRQKLSVPLAHTYPLDYKDRQPQQVHSSAISSIFSCRNHKTWPQNPKAQTPSLHSQPAEEAQPVTPPTPTHNHTPPPFSMRWQNPRDQMPVSATPPPQPWHHQPADPHCGTMHSLLSSTLFFLTPSVCLLPAMVSFCILVSHSSSVSLAMSSSLCVCLSICLCL